MMLLPQAIYKFITSLRNTRIDQRTEEIATLRLFSLQVDDFMIPAKNYSEPQTKTTNTRYL